MAAVSEIVLVYKVEQYIERCVRSLMEQTFDDIEFIFVNDCTPDKSMDILRRVIEDYPARTQQIRIIENEVNRGAAASRNIGLDAATGDYIIFTDSDDWVEPTMVADMYNVAIRDNCDIVWCRADNQYSADLGPKADAYVRALLNRRVNPGPINKLVRSELYSKVRYIENCNNGEDLNLNIKLHTLAEKVGFIDEVYYKINIDNEQSITRLRGNHIPNGESLVKNVADIASYLESLDLDKVYVRELDFCKVNAKEYLLIMGDKNSLVEWATIFPETNKRIMKLPNYPLYTRMIMWLLAKGIIWPFVLKEKIKNII